MGTIHQRGDARPVMCPVADALAVNTGDMVGVAAGTLVKPSGTTWNTSAAITRRAFAARFLGVSAQYKAANAVVLGNSGDNAAKIRVDTGGVVSYTGAQIAAGTYAFGSYVGPVKGTADLLEDAIITVVTDPAEAIGQVVSGQGVNPTRLEVQLLSRQASDIQPAAAFALKPLAAAGRNGAGAITLTGAVVGERVVLVFGAPTAGGTLAAPALGTFEAAITVADQIQQVSASNLTANTYVFVLAPAS